VEVRGSKPLRGTQSIRRWLFVVEYTHDEIRTIARRFNTTEAVVVRMMTTEVLDKTKALDCPETPEGGIRFKDACEKYELVPGTLSWWVHQGHVRILERRSWKFSILSEEDIQRRVARLRAAKAKED
jgi:hypothetical protein